MPTALDKIQRVLLDVNVCIDIIVKRSLLPKTKKELFAVFIQTFQISSNQIYRYIDR